MMQSANFLKKPGVNNIPSSHVPAAKSRGFYLGISTFSGVFFEESGDRVVCKLVRWKATNLFYKNRKII